MRKWQCLVCSFVYEEALGLPDDGIAPGTSWDDIPDDWMCPECGVGKEDFDMVELYVWSNHRHDRTIETRSNSR